MVLRLLPRTSRLQVRHAVWLCLVVTLVACGNTTSPAPSGTQGDLDSIAKAFDIKFGDPDTAPADVSGDASALTDAPDVPSNQDDADGSIGLGDAATEACSGAAGCPCLENAECDSNLCIATAEGNQCAQTCTDSCPWGYKCSAVTAAGGDISTVCLPRWGTLCNPCAASTDCATLGVAGALCVDQGAAGHFCGAACLDDGDCPAGNSCQSVSSVEGKTALQCQPALTMGGASPPSCTCSTTAKAAQLSTVCTIESKDASGAVVGTCKGLRTCGPAGLSACDAAPTAEVCNGIDDDCNGKIDDAACEDNNVCTQDICDGTACSHAPTPGACNADNNACTAGDACQDGVCKPGTFKNCDDSNPCTVDACDPAKGCTQTSDDGVGCSDGDACTTGDLCQGGSCKGVVKVCNAVGPCSLASCDAATGGCVSSAKADALPCDDGSACTMGDVCKGGACSGALVDCDDTIGCTLDSCTASGGCQHTASTLPCDDGNACTQGDVCKSNACSGLAVDVASACDDGLVCTADLCDNQLGCTHIANQAPCDDGNACTVGDGCENKVCVSGPSTCQCQKDADCLGFDDDNLCNGTLFCDKSSLPFACKINPATVVTCSTSDDTTCSHTQCVASTGKCTAIAAPDQKPCDADANPCTVGDACSAGLCAAGAALVCNDGNACSDDACVGGTCVYSANNAPCDADSNACTQNDACSAKNCVAGLPKGCDDKNPCTADSCNPSTGQCIYDGSVTNGKACDADGSLCTKGDACQEGACKVGSPLGCDDGNACTDDACAPASGCTHTANGGACNADDNACTENDACEGKNCVAGPMKICEDGVVCTADSCNAQTGVCVYDAAAANGKGCDDGSVCTVGDACLDGACKSGSPLPCDDANVCTTESCLALSGCVHSANTLPCDIDGDACTQNDTCAAKSCVVGPLKVCKDTNPCTLDSCVPATGMCLFDGPAANGLGCDDNSVCTVGDSCLGGNCKPGSALDCSDKQVCTDDLCDAIAGCSNPYNTAPCDADGNACTQNDTCAMGSCDVGPLKTCNDSLFCTTDACNPTTGACVYTPLSAGTPCNADNDACTAGDACSGSACLPGPPKVCDDNNPCTTDGCDMATGCTTTAAADGTPCPGSMTCQGGKCGYGAPVVPTKAGDLLLTEVMADPNAVGDSTGEWFEVYNPGNAPILIDQLEFQGSSDSYFISQPGLMILPGQYFTFGNSVNCDGFTPDYVYDYNQFTLANSNPDGIDIVYKGLFIDGYAWTSPKSGYSTQFSPPSFLKGCDSVNKMYCVSSKCDYGTPGAPNFVCP